MTYNFTKVESRIENEVRSCHCICNKVASCESLLEIGPICSGLPEQVWGPRQVKYSLKLRTKLPEHLFKQVESKQTLSTIRTTLL